MIDFAVSKWQGSKVVTDAVPVPAEAPLLVQIVWQVDGQVDGRRSHLIMRTPGNDEALVLGRLLAEGHIDKASDVESLYREAAASDRQPDRIWVHVVRGRTATEIATDPGDQSDQRGPDWSKRETAGETAICAAMMQALSGDNKLVDSLRVAPNVLARLPDRMRQAKGLLGRKRGLHAAALFDADGRMLMLREDVGRHNAIDKVLGHALKRDQLPLEGLILLVSGRISYAMASKALAARVPVMATLSTPTSMAVRLAEAADMTLLAFLQGGQFNLYGARYRIGAQRASS